ncbi:exosporium protein D [Sutcliffiella horikoshii]|uniref:exosporium protein D n=1 Tax=Sutcliffiella horikoshii TaxID=79883 RepID=UPI001CBF4D3C|nr:exosporium protein D [Sutcliffiella horikoshii]UAL47119.1 exosporium protein D [Sutcliffiella horikoshii]
MSCRDSRLKYCRETLGSISPQRVRPNGHKKLKCKEISCELETHKVRGNGESLTGNIPNSIFVPAFREELVVFEDYTENHNKTFLQLSVEPAPPNITFRVLDVRIYTRDSEEPIDIRLTTNPFGPEFTGIPRGIQVENFVRLTVTNTLESPSILQFYIEKTFCICCRESGDKK